MSEENNITTEAVETAPTSVADLKPKMQVSGTVKRVELYGAVIDLGVGTNALIHISQLGKQHVNRVSDVINVGDEVTVWVSKVSAEKNQIMVTMIEPLAVDWSDLEKGQAYSGKVTRLETYGAFVDIGAEREGLVHISELSHDYIKHPSETVSVGDEVQVEVLGYSKRKRRIDLSMKALMEKPESASGSQMEYEAAPDFNYEPEPEDFASSMEIALRKAGFGEKSDGYDSNRRSKKSKKRQERRRRNSRERQQLEDMLGRTLEYQE